MGAIRGVLLVFVCILLFISFLSLGTFATLNKSLDYEIVQPQIKPLIKNIIFEEVNFSEINNYEEILQTDCVNESEYVFEDEENNKTFVIPCEVIANGTEAILDYQIDLLIEENYYAEYDCKFWDCFKKTGSPLFLVSQHAKDHWSSKFYRLLIFSIILLALMFLLIQKKVNFPILAGILLAVSFIPVSFLDSIGKAILKVILSSMKGAVEGLGSIELNSFVLIFFSQANSVFLTGFIIGLILIGVGVLLKLLKVGFKIGNLFSKFRKEKKEEPKFKEVKKE